MAEVQVPVVSPLNLMAQVQVPVITVEAPAVSNAQTNIPVGSEAAAPPSTDETSTVGKKRYIPAFHMFYAIRQALKKDELGMEILRIAVPAALALTADPIASLIDTVFIGRLGPVELAAVGVAISVFNQVSRITVFPISSITTTAVAEEATFIRMNAKELEIENLEKGSTTSNEMELTLECDTEKTISQPPSNAVGKSKMSKSKNGKMNVPSATSALIVSGILGILQTLFLIFCGKPLLTLMGAGSGTDMMQPAQRYLTIRAIGSPAVLLSLALQGIFRGFKDTKTPFYFIAAGDLLNIILDPVLIFVLNLGVSGAALAHCLSQYTISLALLWRLTRRVDLLAPSFKELHLSKFFKDGFLLLMRVVAVTFCVTLATSMAARLGSDSMAAFNVCLQLWLTTSLLADGLAVGGQAILATAFAEKNYELVKATTGRVIQMNFMLAAGLGLFIGIGLQFGAEIFSKDKDVLRIIHIGLPFVAATMPLNTLAFVYDGIIYGASDYSYSAYSMIPVAALSIVSIVYLSSLYGFVGIWIALTIYMALRSLAGYCRVASATGPWKCLKN